MDIAKKAPPPGLNPRDALDILEIRAHEVQNYLAQHPDVDPAVLDYLARHGAPAVRQAVAANGATPASANRILADDPEEDVRAELAIKIARLMPGLAKRETAHIVALTIETLECLAQDSALKVRTILAEEIKRLDCIPHAVALRLARDVETAVAIPVLEYSPLLSDTDLMEIIACGEVQETLTAIARRKPLSEKVSDVLVRSLDVPAVSALLVNPDARIRKKTMEKLIEQAEAIDAWHLPLALRADLSARAIRRIAGFVGAAIIGMMAGRGDLDEATKLHLNRRLRKRLEETPKVEGPNAQSAAKAVADAKAAGQLDDMFVEEAVFAGHRETVIHALAAMAKVPDEIVRKIVGSGHAKPLVALAWRGQVNMRIAFKIQTMIMKLHAGQLLAARGGVDYPLTPEEMRWHLNYFGLNIK